MARETEPEEIRGITIDGPSSIVAEMVRVHGITPTEIGNAKCLDLEDIKIIAKALGKTTEPFV